MEETAATASTAIGWGPILIAVLGTVNVLLAAALGYLVYRRKHQAEAHKIEEDAEKVEAEADKIKVETAAASLDLETKMRQIANEAAENQAKVMAKQAELEREKAAHELDNRNNEFRIHLKTEQNAELKSDLAEISRHVYKLETEMSILQASERTCQEKLKSLEQFQAEQEERNKKIIEYADRSAMLTGLIRKAHQRGFLQTTELQEANVGIEAA